MFIASACYVLFYVTYAHYRRLLSNDEHLMSEFRACSLRMLGERRLRSPTVPTPGTDGKLKGGTHFERVDQPTSIKSEARAYTSGVSIQCQPKMVSPAADCKFTRRRETPENQTERISLRQEQLRVR